MKIEFLAEAKAELDDAVEYYELQAKGLGAAFKSFVKSTIKRVSTFPTAWTTIKPNIFTLSIQPAKFILNNY